MDEPTDFYPGSGAGGASDDVDNWPNIVNVRLDPVDGIMPGDLRTRARQTPNARAQCVAKASAQFRERVEAQLLGKINEFEPDLLLISAGFDGHYDDFYHFLAEEVRHTLPTVTSGEPLRVCVNTRVHTHAPLCTHAHPPRPDPPPPPSHSSSPAGLRLADDASGRGHGAPRRAHRVDSRGWL